MRPQPVVFAMLVAVTIGLAAVAAAPVADPKHSIDAVFSGLKLVTK